MADKLKPKDGNFKEQFIAVQNRGDNTEDFLIGMAVDAGEGSPIIEHVSDRSKRINKIEFTRGDRVVAVRWLHRFAGDTTRLTFVKDSYDNKRDYDVVNSTELRAVGFQMKQVKIPVAPGASKTRSAVARERERAVPHEADIHFVLDKDTEDGIHMQNW